MLEDLPQAEIDRSYGLIVHELVLGTILDCKHLGELNAKRFKSCGGGRPWDFEKTLAGARAVMVEWLRSDRFADYTSYSNLECAELPGRLILVAHGGKDAAVDRVVKQLQNRRNKVHGQEKRI